MILMEGNLDLGSFGHLYFVDLDQTCGHERQVQVQVMGE